MCRGDYKVIIFFELYFQQPELQFFVLVIIKKISVLFHSLIYAQEKITGQSFYNR